MSYLIFNNVKCGWKFIFYAEYSCMRALPSMRCKARGFKIKWSESKQKFFFAKNNFFFLLFLNSLLSNYSLPTGKLIEHSQHDDDVRTGVCHWMSSIHCAKSDRHVCFNICQCLTMLWLGPAVTLSSFHLGCNHAKKSTCDFINLHLIRCFAFNFSHLFHSVSSADWTDVRIAGIH